MRVALLAPADHHELGERLQAALASQLADLPVDLRIEPLATVPLDMRAQMAIAQATAQKHDAAAVVWANTTELDRVLIYLASSHEEHVYVREVEAEATGLQGRAAAVALVVRAAVQSILVSAELPPPIATPVTLAAVSPPPVPPTRHVAMALRGAYRIATYAPNESPTQSACLGVTLTLSALWRAMVGYRYTPARHVATELAAGTFASHPITLQVGVLHTLGALVLEGNAGLLIDPMTWQLTRLPVGYEMRSRHSHTLVAMTAGVGARWPLTPSLSVFAGLDVDVPVNERAFVVTLPEGKQVLARPWLVRPGATAGLAIEIW